MPKAAPKRVYKIAEEIKEGFEISDHQSSTWIVGEAIAQGGFGSIYVASSKKNPKAKSYVLKIEPQENGPLFTETHFYTRVCKQELLDEWKAEHGLNFLGIPRFISKGLFESPNHQACRFLVMDRFRDSLEDCLMRHEFTPPDIPPIAIQTLDALEYIHSKAYVHADIKPSNLLCDDASMFYLADFGLVSQYRVNGGVHRAEKASPKLRDNGTLEFCSRDAHIGLPPSRRGDLEILLFNLFHWLYRAQPNASQGPCAGLPWEAFIGDAAVRADVPTAVRDRVMQSKIEAMDPSHTSALLNAAGLGHQPALKALISTVGELDYTETPNYELCRDLLKALTKSLTADATAASGASNRHKHVLVEVNSRAAHNTRPRKVSDRSESVAEKPNRRRPTDSQHQARNVVEACSTSQSRDGVERDEELVKPSSNTTFTIGARIRPPARRSTRTRRAMNRVFEPSDESDNNEDFVVTSKRTQRHQKHQQRTRSRPMAPAVATQTSPHLIRQLEREERRRNFF
ncbi:Serine/threonine-protein kinase VRK1 [Taenia crassiceps]|uniref:non-specific serine/threonine protein kinase n=1 Tax=Taenia crassiceps TaxID=6207 RepID=A0ABR4Q667_9CEST